MHMKLQISQGPARRLCALLLLLLFAGPWLLAFSMPDALTDASLPACCRAHGKHRCFMRLMDQDGVASTSGQPVLSQISARCPYNPSFTAKRQSNSLAQLSRDVAAVGFSLASPSVAITARPFRSLSSLANCKRGPPSSALSLESTTDWLAAQQRLPLRWRHDVSIKTNTFFLRLRASPDSAYSA
jgi:hypothetical protein